MNLEKCKEAYRNDVLFNALVKNLEHLITELKMSPSEVREAAMFAVYLTEMRNPSPIMFGYKECK